MDNTNLQNITKENEVLKTLLFDGIKATKESTQSWKKLVTIITLTMIICICTMCTIVSSVAIRYYFICTYNENSIQQSNTNTNINTNTNK